MIIQIDSREKSRAITKIVQEFDRQGIQYFVSKLWVADYMSYDNPRVVVDRKQNLTELCSNVCQEHERFRAELVRAQQAGIQIVVLCEHGGGIRTLQDVVWWDNPRSHRRERGPDGKWRDVWTNATRGDTLYKILCTLERKYGVRFEFCNKEETGKRIIEILRRTDDARGNKTDLQDG